ncbi:hypothetical protein ACH3XW_23485 [Acanthocheilonema viteae]
MRLFAADESSKCPTLMKTSEARIVQAFHQLGICSRSTQLNMNSRDGTAINKLQARRTSTASNSIPFSYLATLFNTQFLQTQKSHLLNVAVFLHILEATPQFFDLTTILE